jgi:hypothetical protein
MDRTSTTVTFAGCPIEPALFAAWERHWAPQAQPFFVSDALVQRLPAWPRFTRREFRQSGVPLSLHDTFTTYNVADDAPWVVWLTYGVFSKLGHTERADLLREQRLFGRAGVVHLNEVADQVDTTTVATLTTDGFFVWWPQFWKLLREAERYGVLKAFVETDRLPCRRSELGPDDWQRIATCLPGARDLAGSFLPESGGNCLATVMAAFGAPAVAERWVHPEPFERWLGRFTLLSERSARTPLERADLGHVWVWRDENARIQHAAVGLGSGLVLHKKAQGWYAPRQVSRLAGASARWQGSGRLSVYEPAKKA